jgi:hypothetical protein
MNESVVTPLQSVDIPVLTAIGGKDSRILASAFDSVSIPIEQRTLPEKPTPRWPYFAEIAGVLLCGAV